MSVRSLSGWTFCWTLNFFLPAFPRRKSLFSWTLAGHSAPANMASEVNHTDQPIFWFVLLNDAIDRGDWKSAAHAQQELERLGIHVRHTRRSKLTPARPEAANVK
jgi:hypothetical protein